MFVIIGRDAEEAFESHVEALEEEGFQTRVISKMDDVSQYLGEGNLSEDDYLIHSAFDGSIVSDADEEKHSGFSSKVEEIVRNIHENSPYSRVTIMFEPNPAIRSLDLSRTSAELKADGYTSGILTVGGVIETARLGHVSESELHRRGIDSESLSWVGGREGGLARRSKER